MFCLMKSICLNFIIDNFNLSGFIRNQSICYINIIPGGSPLITSAIAAVFNFTLQDWLFFLAIY